MQRIETERLVLRQWRMSDAADLFKYASDPEVGPRAGWLPHKDINESKMIINKVFMKPRMWAIVLKQTHEVIGCIGYLVRKEGHFRMELDEAEVGYWIGRDYWNKGICSEALKAMIKYCFYERHYTTLFGCNFEDNPASGRVMEKCGFEKCETLNGCRNVKVGGDKRTIVRRLRKQNLIDNEQVCQ